MDNLIKGIEDSYENRQWRDLARDKFSSAIFNITILLIIIAFIFLIFSSFNDSNVHNDTQIKQIKGITK